MLLLILDSKKNDQQLRDLFKKKKSVDRGKTWNLLLIAFRPFLLEEMIRKLFLDLKKVSKIYGNSFSFAIFTVFIMH